MNGHGGARPGAGRPISEATKAIRSVVNDPTCIEAALAYAKTNPEFWLRLYQQIHGKPPQALDIRTAEVNPDEQFIYRAGFEDGEAFGTAPDPAEAQALPAEAGE